MHGGNGQSVLVGMSGGVDSCAAALLLIEQGYRVAGATFCLWPQEENSAVRDAREACSTLGIEHIVLDYEALFSREVLSYFADAYDRGVTPNPCIACNRHIKFGAFLRDARARGFDAIATGHYATILREGGSYRLKKGADAHKDQSYVLYTLTQEQLACILLPLGDYTKARVRALTQARGLAVSHKAESQDICFVPDGDYAAFLSRYTGKTPEPGFFVDTKGNRIGRHRGLWHYTVGQRKGLGVSFGRPLYVAALDPAANTVTLCENEELFCDCVIAREPTFLDGQPLLAPLRVEAKVRYAAAAAPATMHPQGEKLRIVFDTPQRAPASGQAVVFYSGEFLLGGAVID